MLRDVRLSADPETGLVTSAELCPTAEDPDKVIKDMKKWLVQEGLADLEPVSLFAEKLEQVRPSHNASYTVGSADSSIGNSEQD